MKSVHLVGLGVIFAVAAVACGAPADKDKTEDGSQASTGVANPAAVHCESLGYRLEDDQCVFPDGSSCEQWAFWREECGPQPTGPDAGPGPGPDAGPPPAACTPLPVRPGTANPAAVYCQDMGYALDGSDCVFPDASRCEQWSFWRGQCGQAFSFCNLHGGTVASEDVDMGGWTGTWAMCTLPSGAKCKEPTFAQSCICE
jgi:putative hemolysin